MLRTNPVIPSKVKNPSRSFAGAQDDKQKSECYAVLEDGDLSCTALLSVGLFAAGDLEHKVQESVARVIQILALGDGTYKLIVAGSAMALDVAGGARTNGGNLQQYSYNGTTAQRWRIVGCRGVYKIIGVGSGKAIDATGGKIAAGTNLQIYTDNGTAAQQFTFSPAVIMAENNVVITNENLQGHVMLTLKIDFMHLDPVLPYLIGGFLIMGEDMAFREQRENEDKDA